MYFNFDDEIIGSGANLSTTELIKQLHAVYGDIKCIFFDEIQNLPNWELFANRLQREGYNLILTGSNARLLSRELASALTGRHIPIEILPFDFQEFLRAKNFKLDSDYISLPQKQGAFLKLMDNYLVNGGFPEIVVNNLDANDYLQVLFDSLLFRDVVSRYKIRFPEQIGILGSYLLNNFSSLYSLTKLRNILGFKSITTVEKYIKFLDEAYLLFTLFLYSQKSVLRLKSPKKIYAVDNGFISSKAIQHSPDKGKLMENLVFIELVKRGLKPNRDLFYFKTRNNREVDFLIKKDLEIVELIQVCYQANDPATELRETKALFEASKELKVEKLTILTWDEERKIEQNGMRINLQPIGKWLLE